MKRWFVVQTLPGKERLALRHLGNQDFEAFCPMRQVARRTAKRVANDLTPFFPSYVFVRLDPGSERWRSINGTIGVARLVSFGPQPTTLPEGLVERFRQLSDDDGVLHFDEELAAGERVQIVGGPLDALWGTLVSATPGKRVTVLLELLSGATRVELSRERLVGTRR